MVAASIDIPIARYNFTDELIRLPKEGEDYVNSNKYWSCSVQKLMRIRTKIKCKMRADTLISGGSESSPSPPSSVPIQGADEHEATLQRFKMLSDPPLMIKTNMV